MTSRSVCHRYTCTVWAAEKYATGNERTADCGKCLEHNEGIAKEPYGAKWKEHRKFAIISLRDFGVGKRSMEGKILEETRALDLMQSQAKLMDHIKERIREHEETFDPKDIRDFIDAYLLESKKRQADENNTFDKQELATIVYQLFLAGTYTTATTLRWALLYMILHPDIQLQRKYSRR
uniref:Uncharacterized protein n=1 Tax=Branchiostoma floridae TaxID=7739 RepID=C3YSW7_BRAFL|eukprot:XP_002600619.1 hypothetical protein BRAFLDRAFT_95133 [Branchiostoma floridae]